MRSLAAVHGTSLDTVATSALLLTHESQRSSDIAPGHPAALCLISHKTPPAAAAAFHFGLRCHDFPCFYQFAWLRFTLFHRTLRGAFERKRLQDEGSEKRSSTKYCSASLCLRRIIIASPE
ncbi:uncharacterized protein V6R79_005156 [Siganus canaliculatus]